MEESNSLSSIQIAGLLLQNSFHFLLSSLSSFNKRRQAKFFSLWRYKTLTLTKQSQTKLKISFTLFHFQFKNFLKSLSTLSKSTLHHSFTQIISSSKQAQLSKILQKNEETLKFHHQRELQMITKDLKEMQDHQIDLEKNLKKMRMREEMFKTQIQEISGKKNEVMKNLKKGVKGKGLGIVEKIEELKEENSDIREKIAMIESNVAGFIGEMGGLLEFNQEKGSIEKRRVSVKKTKSGKKGRIPLFTVDASKN